MKPFKHQKKFAKNYKGPRLIAHEGGTGKTVCACLWLKDGRDKDALVVCPMKVVRKWEKALKEWGTKAQVVSFNQFKQMKHHRRTGTVIDEADEFGAPLFVGKKRSARAVALYEYVREFDPDILLLSATFVRSTPWNLHTALCFAGIYMPWKEWREKFFELKKPSDRYFGYLQRPAFIERPHWRTKIREYLEKYTDIVLLKDCVKDLPPIIDETIYVKTPPFIVTEDNYTFAHRHQWEQVNKPLEILEIGRKFNKVLVVAYYKKQIADLEKKLKDKPVFSVHGDIPVKKQEKMLEEAAKTDECYLIVQASVGAGFDGDTFSALVYVSMSYSVRDYVQMNFRVRRIHNLHPVKRYFLMGGECDEAVKGNVDKGKDFVPSEWKPKLL